MFMLRRILIIFFLLVSNCYADFPPVNWKEMDTSPSEFPTIILMPDGSLEKVATGLNVTFVGGGSSDTAYGVSWDGSTTTAPSQNAVYDKIETISGGGDAIYVNQVDGSGAATNANFLDNLYIDWALNTVPVIDDITSKFNYAETLAGNPALLTTECIFLANGLLCEGATADTIEIALVFPDPASTDKTLTLPNETGTILSSATSFVGDVTGTSGATVVGDSSHAHSAATITEADPLVDTEAEIEAITGALFGASKAVTSGYVWVADGVDFESVPMSGDVTIAAGGATVVSSDSHGHSRSFVITGATASSDAAVWRTPTAITITAVHGVQVGGTNVIGQLTECDANGLNPVVVDSSDITITTSNVNDDGALSNPSIDANDYVGWATTSVSGTITRCTITFEYTIP